MSSLSGLVADAIVLGQEPWSRQRAAIAAGICWPGYFACFFNV